MAEIKPLQPYKQWRDAFENEKVFTRQDMAHALQKQRRELERAAQILEITRILPNGDEHAMVVYNVHRRDDGIRILVK